VNQDSIKAFQDAYEVAVMNFNFLHLGIFYAELSKREKLFEKAPSIIRISSGKYTLRGDLLREKLNACYGRVGQPDFFSNLIITNAVRGISAAIFEVLKDQSIEGLFKRNIFDNDEDAHNNFRGIVRFIRNTFSHNIRDQIEIRQKDFSRHLNDLRKIGSTELHFSSNYSKWPSSTKPPYEVGIIVNLGAIKDGSLYTDVISEYQTLLFIEFCYNCMVRLKEDQTGESGPSINL